MIEVKDLSFSYYNTSIKTLKNMNFKIENGEIFGLLGPSGAGKSTTQKIIIGILKNYDGSVKVNNTEIRDITNDFYERIGVSFELPNLYAKFTALENLNYFKGLYKCQTEDPMKLLHIVGLQNDANTRVSNFSKGMKMRLNFCRALLNNPDIIFLDEPTSGLDPVNSRNIKDIIINLKKLGKTVFLTTHNLNIAEELCDRVAFIVNGEISVVDSPQNLKTKLSTKQIKVEYKENNSIKSQLFNLKDLGINRQYLELIKNKEIERIKTIEPTLEDIFIQLTGSSIDENN